MQALFQRLGGVARLARGPTRLAGIGRSPRPRRIALEMLEPRLALDGAAPSFPPISDQTVLGGAPSWLGIDGTDADGGPLTYTVSVTNPNLLQATISPASNRVCKWMSPATAG